MIETINLKGNSVFEQNINGMISLGALFVCVSSALATQQFMMNYWKMIFSSGISIVFVALVMSYSKKFIMSSGFVKSDARFRALKGKKTK